MSILKVARMGHPVLRQKARPLEKHEIKSAVFQQFVDDMFETMSEYSGVGLAAPQVHQGLRVFVAHLDTGGRGESEPIAVINPEIRVVGQDIIEGWEGCLSIPDIRGRVPRAIEINVTALDRNGRRFTINVRDFPARVIQHETDHLDGILFFDRMRSFETLSFMEEFSRFHSRKEDDADEQDEEEGA